MLPELPEEQGTQSSHGELHPAGPRTNQPAAGGQPVHSEPNGFALGLRISHQDPRRPKLASRRYEVADLSVLQHGPRATSIYMLLPFLPFALSLSSELCLGFSLELPFNSPC